MKIKPYVATILSVTFLVCSWELISLSLHYPDLYPPVDKLLTNIIHIIFSKDFGIQLLSTILRGGIGFMLSLTVATILSIIAYENNFCEQLFKPVLLITRSTPVISVVLLAMLWLSADILPVCIAFIAMFPILYQNILTGLKLTDKRLLEMARIYNKSRLEQYLHIHGPMAHDSIFDGLKTAMGFGWRAVIIGEVLSQPLHGIGTAMKQAQAFIQVADVIAWTVIAVLVSYIFEALISYLSTLPSKHRYLYLGKHLPADRQKNTTTTVELDDISKMYDDKLVIAGYNARMSSPGIYLIKGQSGIGKTTLLRIVAGLEKPDYGKVIPSGKAVLAYAFQDVRMLPWLTITENMLFACGNSANNEKTATINNLLAKSGLEECAHQYPHELSGGQLQRAALIRALSVSADILILDEPLTGLDSDTRKQILDLISQELIRYKPLVIWATHEQIRIKGCVCQDIQL